jgi:hypothetical protein
MMKKFPNIVLHTPIDNQVKYWQAPDREDPFDRIVNLPPLSLIDIEYLGVSYQQPIARVVLGVKVKPLDDWTRAMNRAEALQIQYADEGEISAVRVSPDGQVLLKLIDDVIGDDVKAAQPPPEDDDIVGLASRAPSKKKQKAQAKKAEEDEVLEFRTSQPGKAEDEGGEDEEAVGPGGLNFLNVSSAEFLPDKKDVEGMGVTDVLAEFKTAPLFPAKLR